MFDRVLNTPLSYGDNIWYYNTDGNRAIPGSEIQANYQVLQQKQLIIASGPDFFHQCYSLLYNF